MIPLNQSRKIALTAVALFIVSMGILFVSTNNQNSFNSLNLKAELLGHPAEKTSYEDLVKNSSDPVVVIQNNKISYISPDFEKLLGYNESDLIDVDIFELVHPDDVGNFASFITKITQDKEELKNLGPFRIQTKSGQYRIYMASASIVINGDKSPRIIITMKDITKSVEDINQAKEAGKPIKTMKDETDKKIMVDKSA